MELINWDEEYDNLSKEIGRCDAAIYVDVEQNLTRRLAHKQRTLKKISSYTQRILLRFKRLNQVTLAASKTQQALVYWGGELAKFANVMQNNYELYLKRFMWIKLLRIRYLGESPNIQSYLLADSEIDNMMEKHKGLHENHRRLQNQYQQLCLEEMQLNQMHSQVQTEEANFLAGHSLQKQWGIGTRRALKNPLLGELQKLLFGIAFKARPYNIEAEQLKALSGDFSTNSKKIVEQCRQLLDKSNRQGKKPIPAKNLHSIKESIRKISTLEAKVDELSHKTMPLSLRSSPILLKKRNIQVTTKTDR